MDITELCWQDATEAILWKVEPPQVCDVGQGRADGAEKVEPGQVQCDRMPTAVPP